MIRRRSFLTLLGAAAAAWPVGVRAQQLTMPVIGFLGAGSHGAWASRITPFVNSLKDMGFNDGNNVRIEYRWAEDRYERLSTLAGELVGMPVSVIVAAGGAQTAFAAKEATDKIPIVFQNGSDPVQIGLVASLAKPGGNLTGVTNVTVETVVKRIELIRDLVPAAKIIGYLTNPLNPNAKRIAVDMKAASQALRRDLITVGVTKRQISTKPLKL
jgi:putative ABC transport system substrate-binding protein